MKKDGRWIEIERRLGYSIDFSCFSEENGEKVRLFAKRVFEEGKGLDQPIIRNLQEVEGIIMSLVGVNVRKLGKTSELRVGFVTAYFSVLLQLFPSSRYTPQEFERRYPEVVEGESKEERERLRGCCDMFCYFMDRGVAMRGNKGLVMKVVPRLVEGKAARYVTGGGARKATTNRILMYEREGGVRVVERPSRKKDALSPLISDLSSSKKKKKKRKREQPISPFDLKKKMEKKIEEEEEEEIDDKNKRQRVGVEEALKEEEEEEEEINKPIFLRQDSDSLLNMYYFKRLTPSSHLSPLDQTNLSYLKSLISPYSSSPHLVDPSFWSNLSPSQSSPPPPQPSNQTQDLSQGEEEIVRELSHLLTDESLKEFVKSLTSRNEK